jgi:hypothetical protein
LIEQRSANILEHIKQGKTAEQIADAEGITADDARKLRLQLAKKHDVRIPKAHRAGFRAIGLDDERSGFRVRLGYQLQYLRDEHHPVAVSKMTGLTQAEQRDAVDPRKGHNWTLGQIQRLAEARGVSFEQMIVTAMTKDGVGYA